MKFFIVFIGYFFTLHSFAQKVFVADKETHESLSFAFVKFNNTGFYTDENGAFDLNTVPQERFTVTYLGYREKRFEKRVVGDTIFLENLNYTLPEVVINTKQEMLNIKPVKRGHYYFMLRQKNEIMALIVPEQKFVGATIKEISFVRKKQLIHYNKEKECLSHNNIAYVRINVYRKVDNKNFIVIFSSPPIKITYKQKLIKYAFNDTNGLIWPSTGLYVGLEYIACLSVDNQYLDKYFAVSLDTKHSKYFMQKTYYKYYELPDSINVKAFFESPFPKILRNQNLLIGLKVLPADCLMN